MLEGIETIFDNKEKMMSHLKKKNYEANTEVFLHNNGHFFDEMKAYVEQAADKERAADELAEILVSAVEKSFSNKKGKIPANVQVDLNFFMIYYVFPTILKMESVDAKIIADKICKLWGNRFKDSKIQYTDYDTLYGSFRNKIFGIF